MKSQGRIVRSCVLGPCVLGLCVLVGLLIQQPVLAQSDQDAMTLNSRLALKALGNTLKARLKLAMKRGGPVHAIAVCNVEAIPISLRIGEERGVQVARTSLKVRNPANAPDDWEKRVLKGFAARKATGADLKELEYAETVEENGQRRFRYMKAIPTGKLCLACHGTRLAPDVAEALDHFYPQDQARGFKVGDIRGAFSIVTDLPR